MTNNSDVSPYQATQEDWEDFFANWDLPQGTTYPVVVHDEWLCVVSQHGSGTFQSANQRLDEETKERQGPPPGYEFDR